jgi:hypothetical protein
MREERSDSVLETELFIKINQVREYGAKIRRGISIMPCSVKSSLKKRFTDLSLSLEVNHFDSHVSYNKNWFSLLKSPLSLNLNPEH